MGARSPKGPRSAPRGCSAREAGRGPPLPFVPLSARTLPQTHVTLSARPPFPAVARPPPPSSTGIGPIEKPIRSSPSKRRSNGVWGPARGKALGRLLWLYLLPLARWVIRTRWQTFVDGSLRCTSGRAPTNKYIGPTFRRASTDERKIPLAHPSVKRNRRGGNDFTGPAYFQMVGGIRMAPDPFLLDRTRSPDASGTSPDSINPR